MKKTEIKRPSNIEGKGLIKQVEYLRLLHNVSKTELVKGICSVSMYNRYINNDASIGLDKFEKLVHYFDMRITISL